MNKAAYSYPTADDAVDIVQGVLSDEVRSIRRFPSGLCHYVFDIVTASGVALVVRIARPEARDLLHGGHSWSTLLRPRGVPLPAILAADLSAATARHPYVILERLPGTDLGEVYRELSPEDKRNIAAELVQIQQRVASLPHGAGFGYAISPNQRPPQRSWAEVIQTTLARSRRRIEMAGLIDGQPIEQVERYAARYADYFAQVRPVAFLDDTTTKNVIVHRGRLSGIVDVDMVCYGDSLWTIGLTQTSLLNSGYDLEYIDAWTAPLNLSAEQQRVLRFYSAVFCVDFLSEIGQLFNREEAVAADKERVEQLLTLLHDLLGKD